MLNKEQQKYLQNQLHDKLHEAVRTATDAIMLGDNKDAVAALAKFRTDIAKVI